MRLSMVVDFIDCDFPDFIMTRFPTFNVADSFVTVGVAIVILSPVILRKLHQEIKSEKETKKDAGSMCHPERNEVESKDLEA
jgi:signal peptidase II